MNQVDFAREIGKSLSMSRNYEKGQTPPPEVIERLKIMAVEVGLADVAIALGRSDSWEVRRVFHPSETIITQPKSDAAPGGPPRHGDDWHQMLSAILQSGNEEAIRAVQSNLVVFSKYVSAPQKTRKNPRDVRVK